MRRQRPNYLCLAAIGTKAGRGNQTSSARLTGGLLIGQPFYGNMCLFRVLPTSVLAVPAGQRAHGQLGSKRSAESGLVRLALVLA